MCERLLVVLCICMRLWKRAPCRRTEYACGRVLAVRVCIHKGSVSSAFKMLLTLLL